MFFKFMKNLFSSSNKGEKNSLKGLYLTNIENKNGIEIITYKNKKNKILQLYINRQTNRIKVECDNKIEFNNNDLFYLLQKHL